MTVRRNSGLLAGRLFSIALVTCCWPGQGAVSGRQTTAIQDPAASPQQVFWQVELEVQPTKLPIKKGEAMLPIPGDWPEQQVSIRDESASPGLAYSQVDIDTGLRGLSVQIPAVPVGEKVELSITFAVTLTPLPPPARPQYLTKPEKPERALQRYLNSSESIEPKNSAIKKLAAELIEGRHNDWERIESAYDWVLANIELDAGKAVGSVKILDKRKGPREDRVNLFVALCRNLKVPARIVWADRLEYAEFYLVDEAGEGRWYPCLFTGPREFGSLSKPVIIEQKGDNFEIPGSKNQVRFAVEKAKVQTSRPARAQAESPSVSFMRRQIFEPELKPK